MSGVSARVGLGARYARRRVRPEAVDRVLQYRTIKITTGGAAAFGAFGYVIWATIAAVDGRHTGVEIPMDFLVPTVGIIGLLALTAVLMELAERVIREVVQTLVSDGFALLVSCVDVKLKAHNKCVQSTIKTTVKGEVAAALDEVATRTLRAAIVAQAALPTVDVLEAGDATVTHIPSRNSGR